MDLSVATTERGLKNILARDGLFAERLREETGSDRRDWRSAHSHMKYLLPSRMPRPNEARRQRKLATDPFAGEMIRGCPCPE